MLEKQETRVLEARIGQQRFGSFIVAKNNKFDTITMRSFHKGLPGTKSSITALILSPKETSQVKQ